FDACCVYKTTDGGVTWSSRSQGLINGPRALLIDPSAPNVLYASNVYSGTYRSTDGGRHWVALPGVDGCGNGYYFLGRAVDPAHAGTLYAARHDSVCRSEEHTSELQSRFDLVCRLLLEKKKRS